MTRNMRKVLKDLQVCAEHIPALISWDEWISRGVIPVETAWADRDIELFRLEKASKITESSLCLIPTLSPVPEH